MPLTLFQKRICRLLASARIARGEGYVAGDAALNALLLASRVSRDVDVFHDTRSALQTAWASDNRVLREVGFAVRVLHESAAFVEAEVSDGADAVVFQWMQDSAYRFFPLVEHPDFGLVLHPFDLATNKVLALVGRVEVRDWVDTITCDQHLQPFGCLVWAAAGKDAGLTPDLILGEARRSARYSRDEVATLAFEADSPDFTVLAASWRRMLLDARRMIDRLPEDAIGCCVCLHDGSLFRGTPDDLERALDQGGLRFHRGSIHGAWPMPAGL